MFTHYYCTAWALSLPHDDSVWTPVCSSVILLSICQCDPHWVNQNSAVYASTLYLYLTEYQLFLQWSCWSVDFILFPITDCEEDNLPTVCGLASRRNFKVTWMASTTFSMSTNWSQPPIIKIQLLMGLAASTMQVISRWKKTECNFSHFPNDQLAKYIRRKKKLTIQYWRNKINWCNTSKHNNMHNHHHHIMATCFGPFLDHPQPNIYL